MASVTNNTRFINIRGKRLLEGKWQTAIGAQIAVGGQMAIKGQTVMQC